MNEKEPAAPPPQGRAARRWTLRGRGARSLLLLLLASHLLLAARLGLAAPAPPTPKGVQELLLEAGSPADLRAKLAERSHRLASTNREAAGEAAYFRGRSFERASLRDSAIASYAEAVELRGMDDERMALIDALLLRRRPDDVTQALERIEQGGGTSQDPGVALAYRERLAWAVFLSGHADSAAALFRPLEERLSKRTDWRFRMARVAVATRDPKKAFALLLPLAVRSRRQDKDVMDMVQEIGRLTAVGRRLDAEIDREIAASDDVETQAIQAMNGRRVGFSASDDSDLGAVVIIPPGEERLRAAVVLMAPGDTVADYDSLAYALKRAGFATLLLDPRGSGASVSAMCPLPDTWNGREDILEMRAARDIRDAFESMVREARVDTTRYLVVGVGATASIAVKAAGLDRRIRALVLVSPKPAAVERGPMRAGLARIKLPVFYQVGPEDLDAALVDALYRAGNPRASRVAEAHVIGQGVAQFHHDPAVAARLIRWLSDNLPARAAPPRARRPARRSR